MRVLHSIGTYLPITENWIEPQVFRVPGVEGCVICSTRLNGDVFTAPRSRVIVDSPVEHLPKALGWRLAEMYRHRGMHNPRSEIRLRLWRPSLVHAHFGPRAWESINLAKYLALPLVASFYGYDAWLCPAQDPQWRLRYMELFEASRAILVEGGAMRMRLVALGCPSEKIVVHRIGADLSALRYTRRDFSRALRVVMAGRFVEKKGLDDGLRACALARTRGLNLQVTVIGDAKRDDSLGQRIKRELHSLAGSTGLPVNFTGFLSVTETAAAIASHDVFLCPSRHAANGDSEGGSPVVLTEAMALGLLCIGTKHCDIPEVIVHGSTGYLCDERDIDAMSDLLCAARREPEVSGKLALAGRAHVEKNFNLNDLLRQMPDIYSRIAAARA
jgi:colanic acid/amylovoran biosynthesis glycosyltransferase